MYTDFSRVLSLPDQSARTLCPFGSYILCAALKVFLIDPESLEPTISFSASNNAVHSIRASAAKQSNLSSPSSFLTAAENDRFINVFVKEAGACIGSLVAESDVITIISPAIDRDASSENDMTTNATDQILAAINRDGVVELFESPFTFGSSTAQKEPESLKARMTQRTRKARALVKVVRSDRSTARVPLLDAAFQDHELVLVWTEGGVDLRFDRVQWRKADTMDIILEGVHEVVKGKEAAAVEAVVMNGVKDMGKMHVDESHTVVAAGGQLRSSEVAAGEPVFIAISSGEEETDYEDDELPEQMSQSSSDEDPPPPAPVSQKGDTPPSEGDARMEDANEDGRDAHQGATEADEPTFGEIIRANASGPVDVQAAFANPNTQGFAPANERSLQIPSGMSLGTVLTQSLRTNDISLLETCLHVRDVATIRATIERLDSSLASTLIQRLAERFHSRPGRAGSLLMWIQWTVVAHGGYLASQPGAMRTLGSLHRVISERARSLPLLLSLKGKLDMLEAQMNLRATAQARSKAQSGLNEEDEEGVVYVEGQEEDASEDEPQGSDADDVEMDALDNGMALDDAMESREDEGSGFEEEDEMPTTMPNGATTESDNEGSQSSSEGLFDEEAESTDGDSSGEGSIDDVDHEDVDSMGSDASSDAEEARPSKRPARTKLSNGVRPKK